MRFGRGAENSHFCEPSVLTLTAIEGGLLDCRKFFCEEAVKFLCTSAVGFVCQAVGLSEFTRCFYRRSLPFCCHAFSAPASLKALLKFLLSQSWRFALFAVSTGVTDQRETLICLSGSETS